MELRLYFQDDPLDDEVLRDISNFLGGAPTSDTSYSSVISVSNNAPVGLRFSVELKRRDTGVEETLSHICVADQRLALQVISELVATPTWKHGQFVFDDRDLHDLIFETFSLLRSSRSLSTVDIQLKPFYHRHLPTLLCENPFLKTLILYPGVMDRKDAERIALCFSRNSVLKSCTLVVDYISVDFQMWEIALRPFTTSLKSDANVALKELVVRLQPHTYNGTSGEAIVNLVRCNTTLEKLEVRSTYPNSYVGYMQIVDKLLTKALAVNHTLKEFSCDCGLARLQELVGVFIPDSSGHQANTHLTKLKLLPTSTAWPVEDYMKELSRMLEQNTTLKHVKLVVGGFGNSRKIWEVRSWLAPQYEKVCTQDMLESMMRNELRLNTSLQSLVIGCWKLLRVGVEWHMIYGGPCRARKLLTEEYDVKVKMRQ